MQITLLSIYVELNPSRDATNASDLFRALSILSLLRSMSFAIMYLYNLFHYSLQGTLKYRNMKVVPAKAILTQGTHFACSYI